MLSSLRTGKGKGELGKHLGVTDHTCQEGWGTSLGGNTPRRRHRKIRPLHTAPSWRADAGQAWVKWTLDPRGPQACRGCWTEPPEGHSSKVRPRPPHQGLLPCFHLSWCKTKWALHISTTRCLVNKIVEPSELSMPL